MGTGIEMAEFRVHLPNGEFENFESKVQYKYAVVERCGQKECNWGCNGEWAVVRKSKSWKVGRNAFDSFRFNFQNAHYEYELIHIEEVAQVVIGQFDVELFDFIISVGGNQKPNQEQMAGKFYSKFADEMVVKYGAEWFKSMSLASVEKRRREYNKVA